MSSARWTAADLVRKESAPKTLTTNPRTAAPPPTPPEPLAPAEPRQTERKRDVSITFTGKVPGNNGAGGLLRLHWSRRQKLLQQYEWVVAAARLPKLTGPVRLELTRYSIGSPMDYDNLVSTGKLLIDALVRCGVLPDDSPVVISERSYRQERAEGKGYQKTIIRLSASAAGIREQN
jgi:hypothetical protein